MIKKLEWNNDSVLGDLKLDFSKPDGSLYETVIFAGENGTGKTENFICGFLRAYSFSNGTEMAMSPSADSLVTRI